MATALICRRCERSNALLKEKIPCSIPHRGILLGACISD